MLGRDYSAIGEMDLGRDYTRRAFNNRDRANDQERFFIDFSYDRLVTGNLEKALETCELWTHTYPRDVFGHALLTVPLPKRLVVSTRPMEKKRPWRWMPISLIRIPSGDSSGLSRRFRGSATLAAARIGPQADDP